MSAPTPAEHNKTIPLEEKQRMVAHELGHFYQAQRLLGINLDVTFGCWSIAQVAVEIPSPGCDFALCDPTYADVRRMNLTGAVPLAKWPGRAGKNGGGYLYQTMRRVIEFQKTVGSLVELVLG